MAPLDDDVTPVPLPPLLSRLPEAAGHPVLPRSVRMRHALLGNLPLFLMALLAAATWWLVQSTPSPMPERAPAEIRHEPDYEMHGFSVQHYATVGPARGVIEGDVVRHYPDTDTLEIDGVRLRWRDDQGHTLRATAARAVATGNGDEVRLAGGVTVVRDLLSGEDAPMTFSSEEMLFDRRIDQVRSTRPVTLQQGASLVEARALVYDHADGRLDLQGAVRGHLPARR
ncbi:LPS export ABC transporter periplasmic protein LptC [Sphaerotilus sp.]|uniref:LPS export ABC transporter periplasmic protein LptC n=1 Tax=Sphaerotilus sp. TaxID=2093942 RepID=UPI0034E244B3